MPAEHAVSLVDQTLLLLGERAVYWPAQRALLIADLHLGKADVLRRAGILAPRGNTSADLERLTALVDRYRPEALWILGDMLHGPLREAPWLDRWRDFRQPHPGLEIRVIAGNHDRSLDPSRLGVERVEGMVELGGLRLTHEPPAVADPLAICGHLHPCVRLPGLARRWPAFRLDSTGLLLPAFSLLTGGTLVQRRDGVRCFACVEGNVVPLPASPGSRRRANAPS
ncbi:ligase-associated DNA damage response endonuclease PdeM [Pseudomarimonas salicorniae]|uniref:Ligase-associated DNA damage response endonuclease PdeM n=1 Tax=Pseudomarimonas salicorniae TaxID=2933270 RepID=A0ABT0GLW2_9GAMM|nr:ligase-associated DNA damage response endonuclease PdeM [Lysobacter sp. CAU 1642]MCK7595533.1 ligase-associated DNA damage response endonuclease PdeM [Lysobacter sp. CAU 1642]